MTLQRVFRAAITALVIFVACVLAEGGGADASSGLPPPQGHPL
jgi:hypothetical protein